MLPNEHQVDLSSLLCCCCSLCPSFCPSCRRHADQEARNAALLRELMRQRLAFKMVFDNLVKAEVAEAGDVWRRQPALTHCNNSNSRTQAWALPKVLYNACYQHVQHTHRQQYLGLS